jgi:hypothetical protein
MRLSKDNYIVAAAIMLAAVVAAALYRSGQDAARGSSDFGYEPNPAATAKFLAELDRPYFAQAGAEAIQKAQHKDTFLYRAAYDAHQALYGVPWVCGRQEIGDCVSWAWGAHAVWVSQCVDWKTGRLPAPPPLVCTESVYGGSRVEARGRQEGGGGWSDGSYGGAAAKWCRDYGIIYREEVAGHDLRSYSGQRAKQWGYWGNGGEGDKGKLDAEAKRHPCRHVALVKNFDEAAAAIESGYPVAVCSGQGFSSRRDNDGFAAPSGSWAHAMCFFAVRYAANGSPRDGLLCQNSWGANWNSGPVWPDDQPAGSFWVDKATVNGMLSGEDSFAVGSVDGFPWRDINHREWLMPPAGSGK